MTSKPAKKKRTKKKKKKPAQKPQITSSRLGWRKLRERMSKSADARLQALRLVCATTGYEPLPWQLRFHMASATTTDETSFKLANCGIGSGKTLAGCIEALVLMVLNPGANGCIISPSYSQSLEIIWPKLELYFDQMARAGFPLLKRYRKSMAVADLVCGGRVYMRSTLKIETVRGFDMGWFYLDESSSVPGGGEYAFDVLMGRLRHPLGVHRQGFVTTTPKGLAGIPLRFKNMRSQADTEDDEEAKKIRRQWFCVRVSSVVNTHLPAGYIESLARGLSKREFDQELNAILLKPSHTVFGDEFSRTSHCIPYTFLPGQEYWTFIDWGHSPHLLFAAQLNADSWIVFDEWHEDIHHLGHQKTEITKRIEKLGRPPVAFAVDRADRRMNSWLAYEYQGSGVYKCQSKAEQSIDDGISTLRSLLQPADQPEPRLLFSQSLVKNGERGIIWCLENYRYRLRRDGSIDVSSPLKDNRSDHGCDALRYGAVKIMAKTQARIVTGQRISKTRDAFGDYKSRTWKGGN
tara:strand:- start:544 stop:2103 length:1560 start_codon:yes stop_codon:yes gene_type:complete